MKGILHTFVFLIFLAGAGSLWGQCSIGNPTVTGVSCLSQDSDSPSDDAIQFNLNVSATSGSAQGFWIDVSGGTTVAPQEGTYGNTLAITLGNGTAGSGQSYTLTLTDKSDLSCQQTVVVGPQASCSAGCSTPVQFICDTPGHPGPQSVTLTATGGLTNVLWFNQANVQVGAGQLVVNTTTPGMADGIEIFRYEAQDGDGCVVSLCCPITVQTQDCGYLDLALIKQKSDNLPVSIGQTITFNIQVCNQGTEPATSVSLIDYIPSGFTLNDAAWTLTGSNATRTLTSGGGIIPAGGIPIGGCVTVPINMTVNSNVNPTNVLNIAEITAGIDSRGRTDDIDSTPDSDPSNDAGGVVNSPTDNIFTGDGIVDEDDHDPATVRIVDLALIKEIITPGPYSYGDNITFRITIENQGNETATNIVVSDYVPSGFVFAPNNGWAGSAPLITRTVPGPLAPGASTTVDLVLTLQASAAANAWLNIAEISSFNDVSGNPIGQFDIDSNPDQSPNNDGGGLAGSPADNYLDGNGTGAPGSGTAATDEDDHDPALVNVFDLALRKTLTTVPPYSYGQTHTFAIEVFNQGNVTATDIVVNDYIPSGYTFAPNNGWTGGPAIATRTIAGPLAPGASITVNIDLVLTRITTPTNNKSWVNYAEIASAEDEDGNSAFDADSTPGSNGPNENAVLPEGPGDNDISSTSDTGVGSQDDHDPAAPRIVDIALRKTTVTPGPYRYGDIVGFNVQVINQGNVDLSDIDIVDYIPCGFVYAGGSQTWTLNGTQALTNIPGILAIGSSTTIRIDLRVVPCSTPNAWLNYAEVRNMEDTQGNNLSNQDIDSRPDNNNNNDPGGLPNSPADDFVDGDGTGTIGDGVASTDEDDHDPEFIPVFDLALRKTLVTNAPYTYGQQHVYNIEVFNQGNVDAYNIVVNDYIPVGYNFNGAFNAGWTLTGSTATRTIAGPLAPGASTNVQILLTFNMTDGGTRDWINYAEIGSADDDQDPNNTPPVDADSTPNSNTPTENGVTPGSPDDDNINGGGPNVGQDEDDHDPAGPSFYDVALRKTTTATGPFSYGQIVKFDIQVLNQGNLPVRNVRVIDYFPTGFTGSALGDNFPTWTFGPNSATTTIPATIQPGQSTTVSIYLQVQPTTNFATGWDNYAEVFQFEDTAGNNVGNQDVDSTPDTNPTNDAGGQPYSPADNFVDGNGTGTPGDGAAPTDEDDQDPERIEIIDLALRKTLVTAGPYAYGDLLQFNIEVFNQGNEPMRNTQITDYIPAGYTFNAGDNPGWTAAGPNATYVVAGPIMPATSQMISISLRIQQTTGGEKHWINYAEITDTYNNDLEPRNNWDIDSNPGSNGTAENAVEPGDTADDNITSMDKGGEEDDHDPAGIEIFDLALFMVNDTDILENYGDNVQQTITVTNQGSVASDGFDVTVYVPAGYTFSTSNNPGWVDNGNGTVTFVSAEYLVPGETVNYTLNLTAVPTKAEDGWLVYAEISRDNSVEPGVTQDIDSRPDNDRNNDSGGAVGTTSDNVISGIGRDRNGNMTGTFGSISAATDEDDHDPTVIRVYDMALYKSLKTAGPYRYGQVLDFDVCVVNQGNQIMTDVGLIDYLPVGFEYVAANNAPGVWTVSGSNLTANVAGPIDVCDTICVPVRLTVRQTTGGEKDWMNYAEITSMEDESGTPQDDVDSTPGSDGPDERDVEPGDDADDDIDSIDEGGEEDDHDPAGIEIYDLAMRKVTIATGPFRYGDVVRFTYEVLNQGSIQASSIDLIDYIPCGMRYVAESNNALGWSYDATTGNASITLPGSLIPGGSRTIDIYLQVQPCIVGSTNAWTNIGEITGGDSDDPNEPPTDIDSTPDTDPGNDPGGEPDGPNDDVVDEDPNLPGDDDEDDHDPERLEIVDLALRKVMVTQAPYSYGQIFDFDIEVFNQGNVTMTNIEVVDYIPEGFTYDPAINPIWQGAYPQVFTIIPGPLAPEASITVRLKLKLIQTNGGARVYTNGAEISGMEDEDGTPRDDDDADSTPDNDPNNDNPVDPSDPNDDVVDESPNDPNSPDDDDEDDSDPAGPKIFDLALRKVQLTASPSFSYGQTVMFGIELFNQGNIDAKDIVIVDTLPCGLEYIVTPANTAAGWVYNPVTREVRTTYSNVLAAGQSVQISLDNRVIPCYTNVGSAWTNWAEIESADDNDPTTPNPPTDIDSTPDNNNNNDPGGQPNTPEDDEINGDPNNPNNPDAPQDEDDHDPNQIQVFDLALRKTVDYRGPYMIGETATFRIKVYNQGNVPAQNIVINDYIRSGFSFNAAANPGWTLTTAPTSSVDGLLNYTIASVLMPGDSIILPLLLDIALDENPAVKDWWNYAEIRLSQDTLGNNRNDDADSQGNTNSDRENEVEPDGPWDNVIDGNGPNFNQDEDDHDPEKVIVVGGLGDTVWKDLNGDGIQDVGEPGVEGVIATLTDCMGNVLQTTTTDATGFYFFNNLIPGDYQVQFDITNLPVGCAFTFQNQGTDDELDSDVDINGLGPCTNITGGEFDSTYDAGLLILAAIGDFVWHDLNGDGQQNIGEPAIPGVQVNLYKGDGSSVGTTFTDVNGKYLFDFLYPGDYYLEFIDPAGYERTFANTGSNDAIDSDVDGSNGPGTTTTTYLAPGERDMTWDAGYYICVPIGDLVWYDINKNDVWDTNENGINGLRVNLYRNQLGTWGIWAHTFTGNKPGTPSDDGYFKFCAPPGQYYIQVELPPLGLVRARPNIGNNEENDSDITNENGLGTTASFTLLSGQEKCDIGAGYYPMAVAGNLVWRDDNQDGIQDDNEPKVSGVVVQAFNAQTNTKVAEAMTDEEGKYTLEYLERGDIYVKFQVPAGYSATAARAAADNIDSDVDHSYGPNTTRMFTMTSGMVNENIDMGIAFGVLPVEWLDVDARRVNNTHVVSWSTAKEVNVDYYVVERRLMSENVFKQIPGKVAAAGNTNAVQAYSHIDSDVVSSGVYIYRVKQVDFDGKFTYSKLVSVNHQGDNAIELYPNPATNDANIQIVLSEDADVKVEMYDASSQLVRVIKSSNVQLAGDMIYNVNLSDVPAGVYNVIVTIDGVQTQKKLIRIE